MAKHGHIRIGVGGWTYEPWRGAFYPDGLAQKRELEYAGSKLTAIEINGTYYGSQKPESFAKWFAETPEDFVFTLKGPRFTTNRRVLSEACESVERFFRSGVTELKHKLGPINWQFMGTKKFDPPISRGSSSCCRKASTGWRSATRWRCGTTVSRARNSLRWHANMALPSSLPVIRSSPPSPM